MSELGRTWCSAGRPSTSFRGAVYRVSIRLRPRFRVRLQLGSTDRDKLGIGVGGAVLTYIL